MKVFKKVSLLFLILILTLQYIPFKATAYSLTDFEVKSEAAMLVNIDTDNVMYSKNIKEKRYPASLTKIMTALIVIENCDDIDKKITVPGYCIRILSGTGLTMGNLVEGEEITIRDLLHLTLICSAADAANTLADYIGGGSISSFVNKMNQKAKELKMNNTNFENVHGMHDDNHYTTVSDLYLLMNYVLKQPIIKEIASKSRYKVAATNKNSERIIVTTNMMIDSNTIYYYKYASGIKTGFTSKAGRCLISTASKNGYNYFCIILGGDNSSRSEFRDSKNLYNWAFNNFEYRTVANKDEIISEMKVELAWDTDHVKLYPEKNIAAIVPNNVDNADLIYDVVLKENSVWAPVEKGDIMGYARIMCAGEEIAQVNLIAGDTINRNLWLFIGKIANIIIESTWFKMFAALFAILLVILIIINIIHNKMKRKKIKKVKNIRKF